MGFFNWFKSEAKSVVTQVDPQFELFKELTLQSTKLLQQVSESNPVIRMDPNPAVRRGVVLNSKEELVLDLPALMHRSIKTGSQWQSGSSGFSLRVVKGFSIRAGGSKGKMVATTENQYEYGYAIVTTKRIIFDSKEYNFAVPHAKVANINRNEKAVVFDVTSRDVPDFEFNFGISGLAAIFAALAGNQDQPIDVSFT